jgi:hypothetical protein
LIKINESGVKIWENSYGGTDGDSLFSLQQTSEGGCILGGSSASPISGNKTSNNYGSDDFWVVWVDGGGNKLWENAFGGSAEDELSSIQQTSDGGYILAGYSRSGISGNKTTAGFGSDDYWIIKLAPVAPSLNVAKSVNSVVISWADSPAGFALEQNTEFPQQNNWSLVSEPMTTIEGIVSVHVPFSGARNFFRLKR